MAYDIHPLSFGEILDRAFRVYVDNFALLFEIEAVAVIPGTVVVQSGRALGPVMALLLWVLFIFPVLTLTHAAMVTGVAAVYLGHPTSVGEAYSSVRPMVRPIIGTYCLYFLLFSFFLLSDFGAISCGMAQTSSVPSAPMFLVLLGFLLLALCWLAIYFLVRWSLIASVVMLERRSGFSALRRSSELVKSAWWETLGIATAAFVIVNLPAVGLRFVWGFIPIVGVILTGITDAIVGAYAMAVIIIYYFDRRCRMEDFDLRLLAEHIRSKGGAMTPAQASPA